MSEQERRINRRLISYWNEIKGSRNMPLEKEVDPEKLEDIWSSCFLVQVGEHEGRTTFRFTYLGESLIEAYADDFTGLDIGEQLETSYGLKLHNKLTETLQSQAPVNDDSEFINRRKVMVKYRLCMLPLSDGQKVTYILGGMKWRGF